MTRDKDLHHERIIEAAMAEFLEYGFKDASMRRIASAVGMSASGLYKHFAGKEDMFAALVDPAINGFIALYREIEEDYFRELANIETDGLWLDRRETIRSMEYIYDHFDAFKLIICRSQGTKYESFIHDMAEIEEDATICYLEQLGKKGIKINTINKKELHLLVTANIEAIFQTVAHDFSREEAGHYAESLEVFYLPAWKALFGL